MRLSLPFRERGGRRSVASRSPAATTIKSLASGSVARLDRSGCVESPPAQDGRFVRGAQRLLESRACASFHPPFALGPRRVTFEHPVDHTEIGVGRCLFAADAAGLVTLPLLRPTTLR